MITDASAPHIPLAFDHLDRRSFRRLDAVTLGVFDCPHSTPKLTPFGPLVVRTQDVMTGVLRTDKVARVSEETYRARVVQAEPAYGDLLYSREGTYFGIAAEVPKGVRVCLGQRMVLIRPDPSQIDHCYLKYWLNSPQIAAHIHGFRDGSVAERLNLPTICAMPVFMRPVTEQRAIAAVLGALDDKIDHNRRTGRALEELARATFKAWFVDFDPVKAKAAGAPGFPGMSPAAFAALPHRLTESPIGLVPEGWKIVDVYDLANVVYGAPFASKLFNDTGVGKPLIRIRDLQTHLPSVSTTERHAKGTLIQPGEIVVGMDGEFRLHYWTGPEAWLNQRLCSFQPLSSVPTMYLGEALRAPLNYVERSEAATTVIHLGKYDIDRFELLRPDKDALSAFDSITAPMLKLIVQTASESSQLAALRDYLLPRLLSGRVQVRPSQGDVKV